MGFAEILILKSWSSSFINLDCIMAGFCLQLHYMLSKTSLKFVGWEIQIVY